jgi:hypothetical protein
MRRYHYLGAVGIVLIAAGILFLQQSPLLAQDAPEEPPFLAETYHEWLASPHADTEAEAFVHWNAEGEVPVECATCHSTPGYRDFLGADGTDSGTVDNPAPIGTTVSCDACHNSAASTLTTVTFPSGAEITDSGGSARCMVCHQGRASMVSVDSAIDELGLAEDPNTPNAELGFVNIHYYAAAATLYGSEAAGGYQYAGMRYQLKNEHVPEFDTCASCHNPHTLQVRVEQCSTCHEEVETAEDLRFIRMPGSAVDYDGDGDDFEGIAEEIETLQEMLLEAIQVYASEVAGTPIAYSEASYPYFFIDTNDNGEVDEDEATRENGYNAFTANLLRAAYNYQVTIKDPGGFAHNPSYHIQLLYDSIASLNEQLGDPIDLTEAHRNNPGHFDTTAEAFRHWDEDGLVPGTCARCHTAGGLPIFIENGVTINAEPSNSLACSTCHDNVGEFTTYVVDEVPFPSGAVLSFGEGEDANLCLNCHQGRESTVSVNNAISRANVGNDEVSDSLAFRNVHYFAAGATLFGSEAMGAYQYEGSEYSGRFLHDGEEMTTCTDCHDQHALTLEINDCQDCHEDVEFPEDVRLIRQEAEDVEGIDYDGDGDAEEPIADEIAALENDLLTRIQAYAADTIGTAIVYTPQSHPYWFIDTNGDGVADPDEINGDNRYATWTPTLLRAAYNYQYMQKDPGVFAHNADYALQVLYDSLAAVGGGEAVANYTRPPVQAGSS